MRKCSQVHSLQYAPVAVSKRVPGVRREPRRCFAGQMCFPARPALHRPDAVEPGQGTQRVPCGEADQRNRSRSLEGHPDTEQRT